MKTNFALYAGYGCEFRDIILDKSARNTHENIKNLEKLLPEHSVDSDILLITSGWHMRRVLRGFRNSGFHFVPYAVDVPGLKLNGRWYSYLPSWSAAQKWQELIHEWIGIVLI